MWKQSRLNTLLMVYGIPLISALICRIAVYCNWLNSPVRFFHKIAGLDMMTLIEQGTKFYHGDTSFNIYRLAIATVIKLNQGQFEPAPLILVQLFTGILCSLLVSYIMLHIFGKRFLAAISGVFYALYSPEVMYECVILKESFFLFFCLLSFAVLVKTRKERFSSLWMIIFGVSVILPVLIRSSALAWGVLSMAWIFWYIFRKRFKELTKSRNIQNGNPFKMSNLLRHMALKCLFPVIGISLVFLPVTLINHKTGNHGVNLQLNINYILNRGASGHSSEMHVDKSEPSPEKGGEKATVKTGCLMLYLHKFLKIFRAFEISNNLNYYFMKHLLFPLNYLIGPSFLIPLGVTGLIILVLLRKILKKESLIFIYLLSFMIPLCLFIPLARYRIILLPVFSISATIPMYYLYKTLVYHKKNKTKPFLIILLYLAILTWALPVNPSIRAGDYLSLGKALEVESKANTPKVITCYHTALKLNPSSRLAVVNLAYKLLQKGDFPQAANVLGPFNTKHPEDFKVAINYASALLGCRKPVKAERILKSASVPYIAKAKVKYYYHLGECKRLQNNPKEALEYYKTALRYVETLYQKRAINEVIKRTIYDSNPKN